MKWWFTSFDNFWALHTKDMGTVLIPNRNKMSKETFLEKPEEGDILSA
jgi:hypothetical protein